MSQSSTPIQPPKRFLPALVTAPDSVRVGGSNMDATPSQVQAFEEYKRKHSKQNRDIIKSNAERALRIRSLEDENTFLQMEILNVRHEKSIVAEELKREKQRSGKIRDNPEVKQALDVLLLTIPQITQLRSLLSSTPSSSSRRTNSHPSSPSEQGKGRANNLRTRSRGLEPEPIAKKLDIQKWLNRPGIVKAGTPNLQNLAEGVEEDCDELTEVEKVVEGDRTQVNTSTTSAKPAGRRQSGLFRPVPNDTEQQAQSEGSTSSSSYPQDIFNVRKSPKKISTPSSVSSDIVPRQQVLADPEPTRRSPRKKTTRPNYIDDADESPVKGRGTTGSTSVATSPSKPMARKRRSLKPVEGGLALRLETPAEASPVDAHDMEEERTSAERVEDVLVRGSREATPPSALHEQTLMRMAKAASVPAAPPVLVIPAEDIDGEAKEEEEAGGRQRRARRSVNYKEPNLHFKMRKPEAVVNGHLYVSGPAASSTSRARSSTPSSTPGRKPSQSVVADPDVPPIPSVSSALRAEAGLKDSTQGSGSNKLESVGTGVIRRKSMLPKSRRVESLSENTQNEQANGGMSDNELPSTKEQMGGLGGEIERISSRRRARLGTPETASGDSPSRQPLQSVTNTSESPRSSSSSEPVASLKPGATEEVVRRARRRSTLFQSTMVGEV